MLGTEDVHIVEFSDIGKVTFIRKKTLKNLKIVIRPFKGVWVYIPGLLSMDHAKRFVEEKTSWIQKGLQKLEKYEKKITIFKENTHYQTRKHTLQLCRHAKPTIKTTIAGNTVQVYFPDFADILDERIQRAIRKALVQTWKIESREYLAVRTRELASQWNLSYAKLSVRDNKTRWGSCSRQNHLNLNIHLMRLPDHLCDYVILHELCHTLHKHHQIDFWKYLDVLTRGKARILDKELNNYSPVIW